MKEKLIQITEQNADELFDMACQIFDDPEVGLEEYRACARITDYLEQQGFTVERGIGGLDTAFRATWERGSGGPSIGFLLEYDALKGMGHACAHHLQSPACIGAALALRELCDQPFRLVLYGTPDEEIGGGKITMVNQGCFRDVDVMFAHHAAANTRPASSNRALAPLHVVFHGIPSHAAVSPENGRSALDAMMLAFHGFEIMREHVKEGCRIHYTIREGTGPSNIVPEKAVCHITLRSRDRHYLEDMVVRAEKVINGACMMTETTADITHLNVYWNYVSPASLRHAVLNAAEELAAEKILREDTPGGGSTDVGNVSWVAPTVSVYTYFVDDGGHSEAWLRAGKTGEARSCMLSGTRIFALTAMRILEDPALLETIREEHRRMIQKP